MKRVKLDYERRSEWFLKVEAGQLKLPLVSLRDTNLKSVLSKHEIIRLSAAVRLVMAKWLLGKISKRKLILRLQSYWKDTFEMHVVRQGNGTFQVIWLQQNTACTCLTIATHLCTKASVSQNKHLLSSSKSPRFELTIAQNINSLTADASTIKSERDIPWKSKGVWKDQSPLKKT